MRYHRPLRLRVPLCNISCLEEFHVPLSKLLARLPAHRVAKTLARGCADWHLVGLSPKAPVCLGARPNATEGMTRHQQDDRIKPDVFGTRRQFSNERS